MGPDAVCALLKGSHDERSASRGRAPTSQNVRYLLPSLLRLVDNCVRVARLFTVAATVP